MRLREVHSRQNRHVPDIETLATAAIASLIGMCPRLKAYIDTNDKTPLTDGFIDVYRGLDRTNGDLSGRLPLQVKGRSGPKGGPSRGRFALQREELAAIRTHGSMLFFVVYVDPDGHCTPYYAILSPFVIDAMVEGIAPTKKSAQLPLRPLPTEPEKVEGIVGVALTTRKQQFVSFGSGSFENVASLTVFSVKEIDLRTPLMISPATGDFALEVVTLDGLSLPLPGQLTIYPSSYSEREIDLRVACGDIEYHGASIRQIDSDRHELKLSENLSLHLFESKNLQPGTISLTLAPTLADRHKEVEFFLNLFDLKTISFDGGDATIEISESGRLDDLRHHSEDLRTLIELFNALHADPRLINLDQITDDQLLRLRYMHQSLVEGLELFSEHGEPGLAHERIGPWTILLLVGPGSKPNHWHYVDPFDPESRHDFTLRRENNAGEMEEWPGTAYEAVRWADLASILNLRLGNLVDSYEAVADLPDMMGLANLQVLGMITASDASESRRTEFLRAAHSLNDWIIGREGPNPIHLINRWQILLREGELSRAHRDEIRSVRREAVKDLGPRAAQLDASCAILLADAEDVENCVQRLTVKEREQMETWPIWALLPGSFDAPTL